MREQTVPLSDTNKLFGEMLLLWKNDELRDRTLMNISAEMVLIHTGSSLFARLHNLIIVLFVCQDNTAGNGFPLPY